ncbi:ABC transporter permease [Erythrobacter sp. HL-111]|uniref:ABC transporter permease n=1 Tax=Erythrobacter sp. HL-111 TaxID=1798193 RepID=UPI0006D9536E|nr:ABC transporter permease [Erythrobacter sp. HL-111]KPP88356.1 MAG: ABC-2 type transport system permease protein [Erythrobacteraceae bacterium HL-111]SDS81391.1 ABC-2 type transport system permease protein [Erythrobacter sp. HL-111]
MSLATGARPRLSSLEAAWVIARRDFVAVLFSRAFLFFLLGPLFPLIVGGLAGSIGSEVQREAVSVEIGLAMGEADNAAMIAARDRLRPQLGRAIPHLVPVPESGEPGFEPHAFLEQRRGNYAAILAGSPEAPRLVGTEPQVARWQGPVGLVAASATSAAPSAFPEVAREFVATSGASERSNRIRTAQAAQMLLFLLTMLLAGMVLSNLVEEKANKIIEILAAAIPMDAVFMGKLFAMLGVSFVGIGVWAMVGWGLWSLGGDAVGAATGSDPSGLPAPAVGWALFVALGVAYFSMAYLLLGALFLTIGAMANTVREVQTLSMPVTMMQLMVFFLAAYTITQPGSSLELAALVFPLSSPFAMLARAAMDETLWIHAAALAWQALCVLALVKAGSMLFRKRVMKSGGAGREKRRPWRPRNAPARLAEPAE